MVVSVHLYAIQWVTEVYYVPNFKSSSSGRDVQLLTSDLKMSCSNYFFILFLFCLFSIWDWHTEIRRSSKRPWLSYLGENKCFQIPLFPAGATHKTPYAHAFWSSISRLRRSINIAHIEHKSLQSKTVKSVCSNKIKWITEIQTGLYLNSNSWMQ